MFSLSVKMLRRHNPNIPVKLLYVEDAGHDNYVPSLQLSQYISAEYGNKYLKLEEKDIFDLCKELNVDVLKLPPPIQLLNGFNSTHRIHLSQIKEDSVLLLDADTFIFEDVESLFHSDKDFLADRMQMYMPVDAKMDVEAQTWVFNYEKDKNSDDPVKIRMNPFNSGVVLFNNGTAAEYGRQILRYCNRLLLKKHPMAELMYSMREDGRNREECACTLFVLENNLTWDYWGSKEVQTYKLSLPTKVFHTSGPTWPYYFDELAKKDLLGV
jgi:hypothetical protein